MRAPAEVRDGGPAIPVGVGAGEAVLSVPCHSSVRWLRFMRGPQVDALAADDLLRVAVMTDAGGQPYKLCELVLSRGDLLRAIAASGDPTSRWL